LPTHSISSWVGVMFLDLLLTSSEELIKEVKTGGTLGCSDHALLEFVVLRKMDLSKSRVSLLNCRLFEDLLSEMPCDAVLTDKGVEQNWQPFKGAFLRAQSKLRDKIEKLGVDSYHGPWSDTKLSQHSLECLSNGDFSSFAVLVG